MEHSIALIETDQYFDVRQNISQNAFGNSIISNKYEFAQHARNSNYNTNFRNTGSIRNHDKKQIANDANEGNNFFPNIIDKEFSRSLSRILQKSPFNRNNNTHLDSLFFTEESRYIIL